jgi:hypothetical protein
MPQSGRQLVTYPTACDRRRARGILGYRLARGSALGVLPSLFAWRSACAPMRKSAATLARVLK